MSQKIEKSEKELLVNKLRSLKNWFELDVQIKIFGITVLRWHYPPGSVSPSSDNGN